MANNTNKIEELTIFFPLYNEEKNVKPLVDHSVDVFSKFAQTFEILLINDGSKDDTKLIAEKLEKKYPCVKLISQENKGYGGALKTGFENAQYDWIFFSDGDLQFDFNEIEMFLPYTSKYDFIIGYRKKRAEGFKRDLIAKMLKIWNLILLGFPLKIKDIDCAFKLLKKSALAKTFPINSTGSMVSTEFLLKGIRNNLKIKQIGVSHFERKLGTATGNAADVIITAIKETFKLRKTLSNGK